MLDQTTTTLADLEALVAAGTLVTVRMTRDDDCADCGHNHAGPCADDATSGVAPFPYSVASQLADAYETFARAELGEVR